MLLFIDYFRSLLFLFVNIFEIYFFFFCNMFIFLFYFIYFFYFLLVLFYAIDIELEFDFDVAFHALKNAVNRKLNSRTIGVNSGCTYAWVCVCVSLCVCLCFDLLAAGHGLSRISCVNVAAWTLKLGTEIENEKKFRYFALFSPSCASSRICTCCYCYCYSSCCYCYCWCFCCCIMFCSYYNLLAYVARCSSAASLRPPPHPLCLSCRQIGSLNELECHPLRKRQPLNSPQQPQQQQQQEQRGVSCAGAGGGRCRRWRQRRRQRHRRQRRRRRRCPMIIIQWTIMRAIM